ncbi:MAG: gliding motility lipoprotein GldB [Bacteroidetes bacterium MedPE-SWsnd-G2]|nr:MAG: gliding motility lipoprotein GldB [Bacteroidetes bacterium MedPE-SWsnd-G2]
MNSKFYLILLLFALYSCTDENKTEIEISKIPVDFKIERFDQIFGNAKPEELADLKAEYPFMFSALMPDSLLVKRMNDSLQNELTFEVGQTFQEFSVEKEEIKQLYQHLKYYDKTFNVPRVITVTSDVDYRNKTIVTDTINVIALDTYLGSDHRFYQGIQSYIKQNFNKSQIVCDLADSYAKTYNFQSSRKSLLDEMIFAGKQLYFKDLMIPFKSDADKIGYSQSQLDWAFDNEAYIWGYFIEREMLYSTNSKLPNRFINPGPFSKFYLELDNQSPGRIGQFIGWQIVKSFIENNETSPLEVMQMDALTIFERAKYKPKKTE